MKELLDIQRFVIRNFKLLLLWLVIIGFIARISTITMSLYGINDLIGTLFMLLLYYGSFKAMPWD